MFADLNSRVNHCELDLVRTDTLRISPQDPVTVSLSYNGQDTQVFKGQVQSVNWSLRKVSILAESSLRKLVARRVNLYFDKPKAGDIVSSLCQQAGVLTGTVEGGVDFAFYAVGDQHSAYDHLAQLARQCGFDLYADADDQLQFKNYQGSTTHQFQYAANILSAEIEEPEAGISGVRVLGASPASHGQGAEAASWFTKTTIKGETGSSDQLLSVYDPAARNQNNAGEIAEAIFKARESKKVGKITVPGAPQVKLGDGVQLSQMPFSSQNGSYKVMSVKHALSLRKGFVTTISLRGI